MAKVMVTGGAGFIGSNLVDALLARGDEVVVFDNLATGKLENLEHCKSSIEFVNGDIRNLDQLSAAMRGVNFVLHEGALGSVPRSVSDPATSNEVNVGGTLNVLIAARDNGVKRLVNASSSSVYGDTPELPKHEEMRFSPKSPYALTKVAAEEYTRLFYAQYKLETVSLRYFNVFGPRQDPNGAYAAVIPKFISSILQGESPVINGDGSFSRDFTFVKDVVQANLLALEAGEEALGRPFNVGAGGQITLFELVSTINQMAGKNVDPIVGAIRPGDVNHSRASIKAAQAALKYSPKFSFADGIKLTIESFL